MTLNVNLADLVAQQLLNGQRRLFLWAFAAVHAVKSLLEPGVDLIDLAAERRTIALNQAQAQPVLHEFQMLIVKIERRSFQQAWV